jgi:prepilin-type N-terminal cleavage/methylation domain-containing protein
MASKKIETLKKQSGFTIVELLIVIVVIGILAAITIVAYSGITNRANATKAQTNGANVLKVVEAFNADGASSGYPGTAAILTTYSGTAAAIAKIPTGVIVGAAASVTAANGTTNVQYVAKGTTGGCIGWWDFGATTPGLKYFFAGDATTFAVGTGVCS